MNDPTAAFSKMVPGFDFLQGLMKNAGAAMPPGVGQWIAPTLNPEDLEKRIEELRTVQFWLEQNARMLAASIQALEVQRMTLTTLRSMNVSMSDLTESLKIRMPEPAPPPPAAPAVAPAPEPVPEPAPEPAAAAQAPAAPALPQAPAGVIDPVQWWGALTQQFAQLAASALKDSAGDASGNAAAPAKASRGAGGSAAKTAAAKKSRAGAASRKTTAARRAAKPR